MLAYELVLNRSSIDPNPRCLSEPGKELTRVFTGETIPSECGQTGKNSAVEKGS
jgi:hypothetical protein